MSLIQEALKRQQEEMDGVDPDSREESGVEIEADAPIQQATPETETEPPPIPVIQREQEVKPETEEPPRPEQTAQDAEITEESETTTKTSKPDAEANQTRVLPTLIGVLLGMIVLIGAIAAAAIYGLQWAGVKMPWQASVEQPVEIAETPEVLPTPVPPPTAVAELPASPPNKVAESQPTPPSMDESVKPDIDEPASVAEAVPPRIESAPEAPADIPEPKVESTAATPPPSKGDIPQEISEDAKQPGIQWPAAQLSGIVGNGRSGAAMINGKVVGMGESIEGMTITTIEPAGVWLQYQGDKRFLKVGKKLD